jgi:hypothetical protein
MLVAVGADVEVKPPRCTGSPTAADGGEVGAASTSPPPKAHWSSVGGTTFVCPWRSADEARALLANFESLAPAKMAKRLGLALSPSMSLFGDFTFVWQAYDAALCPSLYDFSKLTAPPEGVIRFVEWDEAYGRPGDGSSGVTTDGCGQISMDLALRVPKIENGRMKESSSATYNPDEQVRHGSAPFTMQVRVWVNGNVAKGELSVNPYLPPRTVLIGREKQLKVKGEPGCLAATHGMPSFEVSDCALVPSSLLLRQRALCSLTPLAEAPLHDRPTAQPPNRPTARLRCRSCERTSVPRRRAPARTSSTSSSAWSVRPTARRSSS